MFLVVVLYTEYGLCKQLYSRICTPPGIGINSWIKWGSLLFYGGGMLIFHFSVIKVTFPDKAYRFNGVEEKLSLNDECLPVSQVSLAM